MIKKAIGWYKNCSLPLKASFWFLISNVVYKCVSMLTVPIFTRMLTTAEMGTVSVFNSWMSIVSIVATLQITAGVFNKAMIKYEEDKDGYTSTILILESCITVILFLIFCAFKSFVETISGLSFTLIIMMFIDIFTGSAVSIWSARQRFDYRYRSVVAYSIISNIVATGLSIIFILLFPSEKVLAKIAGLTVVRLVGGSVIFLLLIRKGKKVVNLPYWKYSVNYNLPLIPHYLSQMVLNQSDRLMIDNICGKSYAGIYSVASQLALVTQMIIASLHGVLMPWAFKNIKSGNAKNIGKRTIQLELLVGGACLLFSLFAPEALYIFGGKDYMKAVSVIPPVCMSVLFITIYTFFGYIEFYYEKTKLIMVASCIVAVANIILNAIFIPIFGFIAAAYTTLVCYILYSLSHYWFMKKICKENGIENPFNGNLIFALSLVFVLLSVLCSFVYGIVWLRYTLIAVISVIGFWILIVKKYYKVILNTK